MKALSAANVIKMAILTAVMLLVAFITMVLMAPTASATDFGAGNGDGTGTETGPPGGGNPPGGGSVTPPSGGGSSGGGGTVDGDTGGSIPSYSYVKTTHYYTFDFRSPQSSYESSEKATSWYTAKAACNPKFDEDTNPSGYIGATVKKERTTTYLNQGPGAFVLVSTGPWIIYTPDCIRLSSTVETVKCYTEGYGQIVQNAGASLSGTSTIVDKTVDTNWNADGRGTYNDCINSNRVRIDVNTNISDFGRYTAKATVYYSTIRVRHFAADPITGAAAYDNIESYDNTIRSSTNYNYAQITCNGIQVNANRASAWTGSGWTWTETDCGPENIPNPQYTCSAGTVTVDGVSYRGTPLDMFRDNTQSTLVWSSPTVTSTTSDAYTINGRSTLWSHSGTPSAKYVTLTMDGKEIALKSGGTTPWLSGSQLNGTLQAQWSTDRAESLTIQPWYRYDITAVVTGVRITSIDPFTGALIYNPYTTTIRTTAECPGPELQMNVLRTADVG